MNNDLLRQSLLHNRQPKCNRPKLLKRVLAKTKTEVKKLKWSSSQALSLLLREQSATSENNIIYNIISTSLCVMMKIFLNLSVFIYMFDFYSLHKQYYMLIPLSIVQFKHSCSLYCVVCFSMDKIWQAIHIIKSPLGTVVNYQISIVLCLYNTFE